jgi:hypothetical protein
MASPVLQAIVRGDSLSHCPGLTATDCRMVRGILAWTVGNWGQNAVSSPGPRLASHLLDAFGVRRKEASREDSRNRN